MRYWEIIGDRLSKPGWSWGVSSGFTLDGAPIFIVDAHKNDGKRFIVRADEKLTALVELEKILRETPVTR